MGKSYATLDEMWKRIPLFSSEGLSEQSLHSSILFCAILLRAMEKGTNYFFSLFYQSTQNFLVSFIFIFFFLDPQKYWADLLLLPSSPDQSFIFIVTV